MPTLADALDEQADLGLGDRTAGRPHRCRPRAGVCAGGGCSASWRWRGPPGWLILAPSRRDPPITATSGTGELMLPPSNARPTTPGRVRRERHQRRRRGYGAGAGLPTFVVKAGMARGVTDCSTSCGSTPPRGPQDRTVRLHRGLGREQPPHRADWLERRLRTAEGGIGQDVAMLDRAFGRLAAVVERDLGMYCAMRPARSSGRIGVRIHRLLRARGRPGVEVVLDALVLSSRLGKADLVITGEGRLDAQSSAVRHRRACWTLARSRRVPAVVVCGRAEISLEAIR